MARDAQARYDSAADLELDLAALSRSGAGPYRVSVELPVAWIAARLAHTDAEIQRPGTVDIEVTLIGEGGSVLVRGSLDVDFVVPCARCLEPAHVPAGGELCVHFVRGASDTLHDEEDTEWREGQGDAGDTDERSFLGNHLDLRPMVEEQILVAYPIRALCVRGEACRGLCMHCGANLNEQPPASRCAACGTPGARVPVVAAPGYEDDTRAVPGTKPTDKLKVDPTLLNDAEGEAPWKAALRTIALEDPADDPEDASTDAPADAKNSPKGPGKLRN